MMGSIADNTAGPIGLFGLWQSRLPQSPEELLTFSQTGLAIVSIIAITYQIIYSTYKFVKWLKGKNESR